ncbi:MAG TPA: tetratricopeptide repeat protein [Allosphingosinicella sp.]|nr:tetratricopeptide repeat protein [Allosphingosinicella sp.]
MVFPLSEAGASRSDRDALAAYVQARAASSAGQSSEAAKAYAAALSLSPGNEVLAVRTFGEALAAGNRVLALKAARVIESTGQADPEVKLLLLAEALRTRDWKSANAHVAAIAGNELFSFMAPAFRAWMAVSTGKGDPIAILEAGNSNELAAAYAAEQRPFLLLASGKRAEGAAALKELADGNGLRDQRLRIGGAALLARKGDRQAALDLLAGNEPALVAARRLIENGKPVPGEIGSAPAGIAEFLLRAAADVQRQNVPILALRFTRLATFIAPGNSVAWLMVADLLTAEKKHEAALVAVSQVAPGDPFAGAASDARIRLLVAAGRQQAALAEAEAAVKAGGGTAEWTRLGDLYGQLGRQQDAATAYAQALAAGDEGGSPAWILHLLRGGALDQAGNWPEAKAALEAAYKLAPNEALVLNYLGYAQLERRENIDEAMRLITEASRLQPDSPEITDSLGWAHYLQGNTAKAIELLERAVEGAAGDPEINEHLGDAYYTAGRHYEARYAWKAALLYAEEEDAVRLRTKIDAGLKPELASR